MLSARLSGTSTKDATSSQQKLLTDIFSEKSVVFTTLLHANIFCKNKERFFYFIKQISRKLLCRCPIGNRENQVVLKVSFPD